jgi:serine/threonine protein kinase/Tol biopolymer transport system component
LRPRRRAAHIIHDILALTPGTRLGVYEITAQIGEGGMGQVYRGTDTTLGRQVAIKILPDAFASDPERLARFEREAKTLASLNHPHIAAIYGFEKSGGMHALVMELVEGDDLSQRIARGAIPIDEALPIAKQIADALEAAHEQGIIHRDLKPANIKVRDDGTVKVLDFGLAKALAPEPGSAAAVHLSQSPTITSPALMTGAGMILGTAAYMAPEQAKGRPADKRSDVWAFGCLLYEMLAASPAFHAEDVSGTLAFVITKEPDWAALPPSTTPTIRRLLRRCLEKDPKRRLQSIGDARLEIEESLSGAIQTLEQSAASTPPAVVVSRRSWVAWSIAAALAIALGLVTWRDTTAPSPLRRRAHLTVPSLPETPALFQAISPDARLVVLRYAEGLMVRSIETGEARILTGTQGARGPFWSPDSRYIGFTSFTDRTLNVVPAVGGAPQTVCTDVNANSSGTWGSKGTILFSSSGTLMRVSASGGPCTALTHATDHEGTADAPAFLPDGEHFTYAREGGDAGQRGIFVASLGDPVGRRLLREESSGVFAPEEIGSSRGWLLFIRPGNLLMAQAFDSQSLEVSGDPILVAKGVGPTGNGAQPDVSAANDGTILYQANSVTERQLVWYDRAGAERGRGPLTGVVGGWMALSPDGRRVAFHRSDPAAPNAPGFMIADGERSRESRVALPTNAHAIVWAPDNERLAFGGPGTGPGSSAVVISSAAGAPLKTVAQVEKRAVIDVSDWSRDGTSIVYTVIDPESGADIWMLPISGAEGGATPVALLRSSANESEGQLSPDGKWLAYFSDEAGQGQIYLRRVEAAGRLSAAKWQVSNAVRGINPRWRADSKELFYLDVPGAARQGKLMAVPIGSEPEPVGIPITLFDIRTSSAPPQQNRFIYAPAPDGQRFLVNVFASRLQPSLEIIFNWARK